MRNGHSHEAGSAMILVIGVIAALAILSASLVMLVGNVQSNTSRDRTQKEAFSLAEAGVDAGMAQLADSWPKTSDVTFDQQYAQSYLDSLTAAGYAASSLTVRFFDDLYQNGAGDQSVVSGTHYDANKNKQLWVESTGQVGSRAVRVRVRVTQEPVTMGLLDNIAVWTPGQFDQQSAASSVTYEVLGPGASQAIVQYGNLAPGSKPFDLTVTGVSPASAADLVMPPELLAYFLEEATAKNIQSVAKYYTDPAAITTGYANQDAWKGYLGLVYLKSATPVQLTWQWNGAVINNDGVNTHLPPGVLIVDAPSLKIQGNGSAAPSGGVSYYGLIYVTGSIELTGGITVHGLVLAGGAGVPAGTDAVKLLGSQQVIYNDNVRANLTRDYSISVRMMPGTWRELQPN